MDDALDALSSLTSKKRATTYKKVAVPIPDEKDNTNGNESAYGMDNPPALTGNGFLFANATLNRVKNRLEGKKAPEQNPNNEKDGNENTLPTQLIANLYDGGEELEGTEIDENSYSGKNGVSSFTQTQRIPVSIQQDKVVNVPIHSVNEENPTQLIKDDVIINAASQTQETPFTMGRSGATQRLSSEGATSQTQKTQPIKPNEPQSQVNTGARNDSGSWLPKFAKVPMIPIGTSPLFQSFPARGPATQMDSLQTVHDEDKTQMDNIPQATHPEDKTQMDKMAQTLQDGVPHTLKIREIQNELASEDSKKEKARNAEYKKPQKTIPTKIEFSKESFLADFDDSSSNEDNEMKLENAHPKQLQNDDELHEDKHSELNITEETKLGEKGVPLLSSYANNLKREIDSSRCITLDPDSDSDDNGNDDMDNNKLIKDENLLPISQLSKATILNLKARLSKQNQKLSQRPNKSKDPKVDHNKLFNTLRKASRKQILDHQREVIETKGLKLEDMVKEKEIVENLLEQEILRNKRIRQKEKRREQLENNDFQLNAHDSGSDSGAESSGFALSGNEITDYELSGSEDEKNRNSDNEEEEDDIIPKQKKSHHVKHLIDESDSEIEVEVKPKKKVDESLPKRIAINLGHYGDNIEEDADKFQETNILDTQKIDEATLEKKAIEDEAKNDDYINEETDEAIRRELIDKERLQLRRKEKEQAAKLKELKKKGVTNFFEMEAEESEDEWHGIGGADGEGSDEYDSDLEKMIDDYSKNNFNPHEIREMLAAENKEMDVKMINKILYDIKNGGFRNKRAKNSLELELSDDEDDVLQQYRLKRRELMRKRRLEIGDDSKLVKNPKSKAFFESMVEDIMEYKNPFRAEEEYNQDITSTATDLDTQDNNSINTGDNTGNNEHRPVDDKNKKIIISEDFVQKSLSFLKSNNYDEFEMDKELARIQHGNDEAIEDLFTLKQHSLIKSFANSQADSVTSRTVNTTIDLEKRTKDEDENENVDPSLVGGFKHPSIIKSFASRTDINDKFKEGNKTVKISKSYKTVGSSKASITYMGKTRKLIAPKRKTGGDHHHHHHHHHNKKMKTKTNRLFESGQDSFDN
ncbi:chromatin-modulating protein MRC1 [Saccharomyces paradoxus]|uniref:Chromatin-modulating protein MRC1 n=1 Tax=Saccharomyces paradoxus TaxID=27291 RepID=A0A8B8UM72_SACPA|nr:Mrc1 [Saccharomyces paradoxus]QHS71863.1 Mrc1 [Saccharomyces paradoxus]